MTVRAVAVLVLLSALPAPPASAAPGWSDDVQDSRQVVVVSSPSWSSSYAVLRAYALDESGTWRLRFGPWPARVGYAGMAPEANRRQNTGTTPAGTFRMLSAFGSRRDPGTRLDRYRRIDGNDWWPTDPRDAMTYNVLQRSRSPEAHWRPGEAERLMDWGRGAYRYSVVLDYNLPSGVHWSERTVQFVAARPADTRKGGAIFLHANGKGATSGCVSVRVDRMRRLLRWLDASTQPRIVIGPAEVATGGR